MDRRPVAAAVPPHPRPAAPTPRTPDAASRTPDLPAPRAGQAIPAQPLPPAAAPAPAGAAGPAEDVHPVSRRTGAPPAALDLLAQARAGLAESERLDEPGERYATAHLAALRTASAVLAVRGRPEPTPRGRQRIRSVWEVLPEIAPELSEWGALFAAGAERRARAEAGIPGAASPEEAAELAGEAGVFLRLVERLLGLEAAPGGAGTPAGRQ